MNEYYVYEWIRLDTNEPFYVGKGKGKRWKTLKRENSRFNHIVNKHPVAVNILHDNLSENAANDLEVWYIREYRDVIGYDLCNIADGGEGVTLCGKNNPMYGKYHTEETKYKISKNHVDVSGENNPMYRKDWREGKSEEELIKIKQKQMKNTPKGKSHPMYGTHRSEETKKKISEKNKGKNARKVICVTTGRIFNSAREASDFYDCDSSSILKCCRGKMKSCGKLLDGTRLVWKYLEDYLEGDENNERYSS